MTTDRHDEVVAAVERRLVDERPLPNPTFRGELGRRLARAGSSRGIGIRLQIAALGSSGMALLAAATLSVLGIGPLGA